MREHWSTGQTSKRSVKIDACGASMANTTRGLDNGTMLEANSLCANLRDIIYSRGLSNDQRHMCWPIFLNNIDAAKSYREAMLFAVSIDKKALSLAKKKINNTMTTDDEALLDGEKDLKEKVEKVEKALRQIANDLTRSQSPSKLESQLQLLLEDYAAYSTAPGPCSASLRCSDVGYCQGMNLVAVRLLNVFGYQPLEGNTIALSMLRFLVEEWNPHGSYFGQGMMGVKVDRRAAMKWMFKAKLLNCRKASGRIRKCREGDYTPDYEVNPANSPDVSLPFSALLEPMIMVFGMYLDQQRGVMFGNPQMADRLLDIVFFEGQRAVSVFSYLFWLDKGKKKKGKQSVRSSLESNQFARVAALMRKHLYRGKSWKPARLITKEKMASYRAEAAQELDEEAAKEREKLISEAYEWDRGASRRARREQRRKDKFELERRERSKRRSLFRFE